MILRRTTWRGLTVLFAVATLVGLVFTTISYVASLTEHRHFGFADALRLNLVQFYLWAVFAPFIFRFSRRSPIEFRPLRSRNLLAHVVAVIGFAGLHQIMHLAILWSITPRVRQQFEAMLNFYRGYFAYGFYIDLIIASLIVIAVHAFLYYEDFREIELAQTSLKTQLAQAQLKALKMQLHPHFLFNTLHSISSLVLEDPPKANSMIARLGDFLRLTLDNSNQQLVTLGEEAEFLRCYLDIEQVRFGDRLTVTFDMEPAALSAQVPHLILQPVVENAIQHAVASQAGPSHIGITARVINASLRLEVKDNGPGMAENASNRQGVGLGNVRARLNQIYDGDFRFELGTGAGGGLTVAMEIPFRRES